MVRALVILDDESTRRTPAKASGPVGPLSPRQQRLQADLQRWIAEVLGEHQYELRRSLEPPPPPPPAAPQASSTEATESTAIAEAPTSSQIKPAQADPIASRAEQKDRSPHASPPSTADPPQGLSSSSNNQSPSSNPEPQTTSSPATAASSKVQSAESESSEWIVFMEWSLLQNQTSAAPSTSSHKVGNLNPQERLEKFIRTLPVTDPSLVKIFLLLPETAETQYNLFRNLPIADIFPTPIDPSLFKQKLQFWSTPEGKKVSPAHLFRRAAKQRVLLGKDVILDQINEIRGEFINPRRLKRGKIVWLHAVDLGPGRDSRLAGQVVDVEPEGQAYRVSLRWIGITSTQLKNFRKLIKDQRGRAQKTVRPPKARLPSIATKTRLGANGLGQKASSGQPTGVEPPREPIVFNLAVIDPDPMSGKLAASSLEEIAKLKMQSYPSLSRFLRRHSAQVPTLTVTTPVAAPDSPAQIPTSNSTSNLPTASTTPTPPNPSEATESTESSAPSSSVPVAAEAPRAPLWKGPLQGRLRLEDEALLELKSGDTETIAGQSLERWQGDGKLWESIFSRDDLEEWREQLRWLGSQKGDQTLDLTLPLPLEFEANLDRPPGAEWRIHLQLEMGEREASARFEIRWSQSTEAAAESNDGASSSAQETSTSSHSKPQAAVDAVAIDLHLLGGDAKSRVLKLRTLHRELESRRIFNSFGRVPPLIVLVDEKLDVGFEDFEGLFEEQSSAQPTMQVYFHRKIYDRHLIAQLFLDVAPDAFHHPAATKERLTPISMSTTLTQAYTSVSLAEYGLELQMPFALQRGAGLRMFSEALEFGDQGVWVKCVSSGRQSDGSWINEFVFFGSVERIQQKLRAWIRKEYAQEKAAQSS